MLDLRKANLGGPRDARPIQEAKFCVGDKRKGLLVPRVLREGRDRAVLDEEVAEEGSVKTTQVKESYLWAQVSAGLTDPQTHLTRVENDAGTGISDVSACRGGVSVFIELKVFHGNNVHFRTSQRTWIVKRTNAGGRVLVVVRDGDKLLVYPARECVLSECTVLKDKKSFYVKRQDLPTPLYTCDKPFKWSEVRNVVFGPVNSPESSWEIS